METAIRHKWTFVEMLISSGASLVASLVLSVDAWLLAANPDAALSCNISATISCGKVALAWQSTLLGFPNAFIGLICEPVVITIAVASLARVRFPRVFMLVAQFVYFLGLLLAYWLFSQAYFNIGALCPWCLVITFATTTVFITMTRVNILDGHLRFPGQWQAKAERALHLGADTAVMLLAFALIAAAVLSKYFV